MGPLSRQTLPARLSSGSHLTFYLAVSREDPKIGSHHGFGIVIGSDESVVLDPIQYRSQSDETHHMAAALGGALTIMEWVERNCEPDIECKAYTNESYIYEHLRPRIKEWLSPSKKKRPNVGLLEKLDPLLDKYPHVEFMRESSWSPELMTEAKALASEAAGHPQHDTDE